MLTGNQDLTTAMEAVNEGQVFRFLNKPCQMSDIKAAINAGIKQYDLVTSKEELLKKPSPVRSVFWSRSLNTSTTHW